MLSLDYLENKIYTNNIVKMYQQLNTKIINDVIRKLEETGDISSYTKQQILNIAKRGGKQVFIDTLKSTNKLTLKRKKELIQLFTTIIKEDMESYISLYEKANVEFKMSKSQINILNTIIKTTNKELQNFTRSIAFNTQKDFIKAIDEMYLQVVTGVTDYQTAFRKATNEISQKGVTLTMSNGKNRSIESAVRQNISYAIKSAVQDINDDISEKLGCDGVQINITPNCRPEHRVINGEKFKINSKQWQKYKDLLQDYNCQHYATPIFYDIEDNIYSKKEITSANNRKVIIDGEEIPYYEATQKQRALERAVRNAKKEYMNNKTAENKRKVLNSYKKIRDFCSKTGLERQYDREYYAGFNN